MTEFARAGRIASAEPARVRGWTPCRAALSASTLVSDSVLAGVGTEPTNNLLLMDGELHHTVRRLVTTHFTGSRLAAVGQRLEATAAELVRSLSQRSTVDLIADLAEPLVLAGILAAMGIPDERRAKLGDLTRGMLGLLEPELPADVRRRAASAALRATLLFERDGAAGTATGLHATLEAAARDGAIPVKLARSTPVVVLHGGYENPLNQLGCLIDWAVRDPDRFRVAAVSAPAALFEEVLRVYSPVRLVARWAAADGECGGLPVARGRFVWVDLASANRDERRFPAATELDLTSRRGHLGFGHGRHVCLGAALARLEGRVLIRSLLALPDELLRGVTVEWRDGVVARGPSKTTRSQ